MLIPVEFTSLTMDKDNAPLMILTEQHGSRAIRIAVNGYDANRLALSSFKGLTVVISELPDKIISSLGATFDRVVLSHREKQTIQCDMVINRGAKSIKVEARPGEAVAMAITKDIPIFADEKLFYTNSDEISLGERLRAMSCDQFGHILLH